MKQFENGYISMDVYRAISSTIDAAADQRRSLSTNVSDLEKYWKPKKSYQYLRENILAYLRLEKQSEYFKPNNP